MTHILLKNRLLPALALVVALASPVLAVRSLTGSAEWNYASWTREEGGQEVATASHFTQQYSAMYSIRNIINGGRGGQYDLRLGADYTVVDADATINGEDQSFDLDTFKLLYEGDLRLEPGGLPFRLHAYARDLQRPSFDYNSFGITRGISDIDPNIVTDIFDGTTFETGLSLVAGIRNGHYLGRYRNILSHLPKLYVDYKQTDVRDLKSLSPEKYRERDLAFVSLNKKDNWFHYRYYDYKDYLHPEDDFNEATFMLGTVDQLLVRRWINLTNWIQVSADGSYTVSEEVNRRGSTTDRYDVNLFGIARRSNWEVSNFTNYQRVQDGVTLSKSLEVPVYSHGELSRSTRWRFRGIYHGETSQDYLTVPDSDNDVESQGIYLSSQVDAFAQSRYIATPSLEVEYLDEGDDGDSAAARVAFEYYSNPGYRPRHALWGRIAGTYIDPRQTTLVNGNGDYWELELSGRVDSQHTSRFSTRLEEQTFLASSGFDPEGPIYISPNSNFNLTGNDNNKTLVDGATVRSVTTVGADYTTLRHGRHSLELILDYLSSSADSATQVSLNHRFEWDRRALRINAYSEFIGGDALQDQSVSTSNLGNASTGTGIDWMFDHTGELVYSSGRLWELHGSETLTYAASPLRDVLRYRGQESFIYNFYHVNGFVRKLADIRQGFEFDGLEQSGLENRTEAEFSLMGNYWPVKVLQLTAETRYRYYFYSDQAEWSYLLASALDFEKLKVYLEYRYGEREGSTDEARLMEHRWELNVKKIF